MSNHTLLAAAALSLVTLAAAAPAHAETKLTATVHTASPGGFLVNSTLIAGDKEAVLIDAQFSLADAHRLIGAILESKKTLTTVYITHSHPDHYFGLVAIRQAFPKAKLVATPGCYPTASVLALAPLAERGLLSDVVIDAKQGVSGAGRGGGGAMHYVSMDENAFAYKTEGHRHRPNLTVVPLSAYSGQRTHAIADQPATAVSRSRAGTTFSTKHLTRSGSNFHSAEICQASTRRRGGSQTSTLPQLHSEPSSPFSNQRPPTRGSMMACFSGAWPMWCSACR